VTITKQDRSTFFPGYTAIGASSVIVAPQASVAAPLRLTFKVFVADMPEDFFPRDVEVFRNGRSVPDCEGSSQAVPDPCVTNVSISGGVETFTVLTSRASTWDLEAANVTRASGADRYATAIAVSQTGFLDHSASAVVLATGEAYPDAVVGTPLAAAKAGPLLLTHGASLPAATKSEIQRVLKPAGTVYVLGGEAAVPQAVADSLAELGYKVVRYSGQDRYATAVKVAEALGSPSTVLLATGRGFADALAAGTAAAKVKGAVLLTNGSSIPDATAAYLASFHGNLQAVGGPAASAAPEAKPLVGADRYQTSVAVAQAFFPSPTGVGVATGGSFPDALAGGALLGKLGQPLVLAGPSGLSPKVTDYLTGVKGTAVTARLFGGTGVLPASVQSAVASALGKG
jgi:putative cell wall-binding protein